MPQVKHYGVFQFKEEITPEQIDACFVELHSMVGKIPGLLDMIHGPYESDEGMNDGFTHGFIMTFESPESRDMASEIRRNGPVLRHISLPTQTSVCHPISVASEK